MNSNTSLEALKTMLFGAMEGIANLNDPAASENEKTTIEQAKAFVELSGRIIEINKVQLEAMSIIGKVADYKKGSDIMGALGIMDKSTVKEITQ